jgi:hypothetical protein
MKKRLRWLLYFAIVVAVLAAVAYGASWLNARRYYLVVGPGEVEVGKGRMFPVGYEPFRPDDPSTRKAYRGFELPGGIKVARGTTIFTDRVELDQALFRLLSDAARYAMSKDTARSPDLVQSYIEQLEVLPGVSIEQQVQLQKLKRQAEFARGRALVREAVARLEKAGEAFEASAGTEGPPDADAWTDLVRRTRASLLTGPEETAPQSRASDPTSGDSVGSTSTAPSTSTTPTATTATTSRTSTNTRTKSSSVAKQN